MASSRTVPKAVLRWIRAKDDAVVSLTPDPLLFLHHFLGLYWHLQEAL